MSRPSNNLTRVLFVRVCPELFAAVDARWKRELALQPGVALSRADVVRAMLWKELGHE